jgi:hypothetical protein
MYKILYLGTYVQNTLSTYVRNTLSTYVQNTVSRYLCTKHYLGTYVQNTLSTYVQNTMYVYETLGIYRLGIDRRGSIVGPISPDPLSFFVIHFKSGALVSTYVRCTTDISARLDP